ncbi:MAG: SusC/RagA family TonB-linked outer membrane protein [Bacteroidetes bacterium]|nr:SusC/RagA family TonB-linked outer membrane protein [Bacteroidota bacterium]
MMRKLTLLFVFTIFSLATQSQQLTVSGKVISGADNLGIPGANIHIKNKTVGTTADINGAYTLKGVKADDILVFSCIGFISTEVGVGSKTVIDVVLQVTSKELKEVVVTALGINRQKRELGFSTQQISGDIMIRSNTANVISGITGRSAGVVVSNNDGVEGGSTRIVIRGNNNISANNQPLIVVDGVPIENTPGLTSIGRGVDWGNSLNNLNIFDIESYNILKGGAASALYGSRGANGVILITTKRGSQQKGIGVCYNVTMKVTHPYRYRAVQNKYGAGGPISFTPPTFPTNAAGDTLQYPGTYSTDHLVINQAGQTSSSVAEFGNYGGGVSWGPEMKGELIKWWDGKMRYWSPQPDNLKMPFHDGYTMTHNISASGGGQNGTMRVSITRQDQKPIIENSNSNQTTVNLAGNLKVSDKVRAELSVSYIKYNRLNSPVIGEDQNSINKGLLYSWPRSYQGEDKANYTLAGGAQNPMTDYPYLYVSPTIWWNYYNNNTTLDRDKYLGSLSLIYDITPWLNLLVRTGKDFTLSHFETKIKPIDVVGLTNGGYSSSLQRDFSDNGDFLITATKENILHSKFNVKFSAGGSTWQRNYYSVDGRSGKWYYPNMYSLLNYTETTYIDSAGHSYVDQAGNLLTDVAAKEDFSRRRTNSIYSFLNLSFNSYLFADITGRNDWSSTLPVNNNSYFYPSLTLSFIASDAFGLPSRFRWLDFLKIRGSVAQTASDLDPYQTEFYYTTSFFGASQSSYYPSVIPPYTLKPQRVNTYEAGINIALFDNKIDLDVTYYHSRSFDQIITLPIPITSGAGFIRINEGVIGNRGIEIVLNTVPIETNKVILKTGLTFARNRSKIVSLGDFANNYTLADIWGDNGPAMLVNVGDEYGTIFGWDYVYDKKGNRIVNDAGTKYLVTTDRVPIGHASADFTAGWTTELTYNNFRLTTLVDTKWGGDIYCGSYVIGLQTGQSPQTLKERDGGGLPYTDPDGNTSNIGVILEGVHQDGTPNTTVVHYYYKYLPNAGGWGQGLLSKPGILENTWVKMREISLSYTFPPKILTKQKVVQSLTVSLTGRDLFYIYTTLPDKINPEGLMGSGNAQGFEWASYPGTRSVIFSVSANF